MASSRCVSTRLSDDVYAALSERARSEGITLSSLLARLLQAATPQPVTPKAAVPAELQGVLFRLQNLEHWAQLLFEIVASDKEWTLETIDCPGCQSPGLEYFEALLAPPGSTAEDRRPVYGFCCPSCDWSVDLTEAAAGRSRE